MKLLMVNENPLEKLGDDYHSVYSWVNFPLFLSRHFERATLWSPVKAVDDPRRLSPEAWKLDLGPLAIEPHDLYESFAGYYRLYRRRARAWRRAAARLAAEHDVVVIRAPSPILPIVAGAARRAAKPLVLIVGGDIASASCRIVGSRGLTRLAYRALAGYFVSREKAAARRAAAVYVYSEDLARRHRAVNRCVRLMRTPVLSDGEIHHRPDTCQDGEIRLLRVCWLYYIKGLECLLHSFARLLAAGVDARLEIAGKERIPGYQRDLEDLAGRLGIGGRVHFSGWTPFDKMRDVYLRSDIQVVSSSSEGAPRCVVEGAARGLPLVATTAGGCSDFLVDRTNALLVPPDDPPALARAVEEIIGDPSLRRRIIHGGYQLARQSTIESLGMRFVQEMKEIIRAHES